MTVGLAAGQAEINARAGATAIALRDALRMAADFNTWLQDTTIIPNDQFLINMGFSQAEVNTLRAAYIDANNLYRVSHGLQAQPGASDFFSNLKKLWGTSV